MVIGGRVRGEGLRSRREAVEFWRGDLSEERKEEGLDSTYEVPVSERKVQLAVILNIHMTRARQHGNTMSM